MNVFFRDIFSLRAICQFSQAALCVKPLPVHTILRSMYELVISADAASFDWLGRIERDVCRDAEAVSACTMERDTAYLCIGAEKKAAHAVRKRVVRAIGKILLGDVKRAFIRRRIGDIKVSRQSRELLVHALTRFDRETEEDMLGECLTVGRRLDIEGFRLFRMRKVHSRWEEMCELARTHGGYLADEKTFYDLLRFLVDSGKNDEARAEVYRFNGKYRSVETHPDGEREEKVYEGFIELLCGMIDLSPSQIALGGFGYDADYRRLGSIFDVHCNILH